MCDYSGMGMRRVAKKSSKKWIIYNEIKNEIAATNSLQTTHQDRQVVSVPETPFKSDPELDTVYLLLDPHLRPSTPDPELPESMALFEEHKQLAQEYFKIATDIVLLSKEKCEIELSTFQQEQDDAEEEKFLRNQIEALFREREGLLKKKDICDRMAAREEWVVVDRNSNNTSSSNNS